MDRAVAIDAIMGGGGGGDVYSYECSHIVKTMAFKRNPLGRTRIYEYTPTTQLSI